MKEIPVIGKPIEEQQVSLEMIKELIRQYHQTSNDEEFCNVYSVKDSEDVEVIMYYIVCSSKGHLGDYYDMLEIVDNPLNKDIKELPMPGPICSIHVVDVLGELKLEGKLDINKFLKIVERKHPKTYEEIYEIYK